MGPRNRREFLADVGRGMLVASMGPALAYDLGLAPALAAEEPKALSFGTLEPLVALLQETSPTKLLPVLVERLQKNTSLRDLTAAAAFANARTFGGENYFGFHVFMALAPAYQMAQELPKEKQALPILKVLYRNAHYTQQVGGRAKEVLHPVKPTELPKDAAATEMLRKAINADRRDDAEQILAALAKQSPEDAFNAVMPGVEDNYDIHSVVLPWRAWAMLEIAGKEHALTFLRQSVRKCAKQSAESRRKPEEIEAARAVVPRLLDKHNLLKGDSGTRKADDSWVLRMSETILSSKPEDAGSAIAAALAEGFWAEHVGEAISLAATQLVLRQVENSEGSYYGKRCHGDSPGVHSSDATNAWRNIARVSSPRNRAAGLIVAAMDVARSHQPNGDKKSRAHEKQPYPLPEHLDAIKVKTQEALLKELDGAIRENDQFRAAALVHRAGELGHDARPLFDVLLGFSISEDGRLHAEKYYRTVVEEFANTRAAYRWRHLTALARVSASAYGFSQGDKKEGRAPGYEEACRLLKV